MSSDEDKPRHAVAVVAQRTGLTPATLRAWERRYGVVDPSRSGGGQRLYSDADVGRLRLLRALTDGGHPIRLVARLDVDEARALLHDDQLLSPAVVTSGRAERRWGVAEALAMTRRMDGPGLQAGLRHAGFAVGVTTFLDEIVGPFLTELGDAWSRGELGPAEEHVASEAVEAVLTWLVEPAADSSAGPTLVVGTLPGELHRLGARLVMAAARFEGWSVAYLGADLPGTEIARVARSRGAAAVAISVVGEPTATTHAELAALRADLPAPIPIWLGGRAARSLGQEGVSGSVRVLQDLPALRAELRSRV